MKDDAGIFRSERQTSLKTEVYRERLALWKAEQREHQTHEYCVRYGDNVCIESGVGLPQFDSDIATGERIALVYKS